MLALRILSTRWKGRTHRLRWVGAFYLTCFVCISHGGELFVEDPPPQIPKKALRGLYYILSFQPDGSPVTVPVTVCFSAVFDRSSHPGSHDLRQESNHWKNRMSREGVLYAVEHLGVDLSKQILFLP
jgi:hypothetical protein